MARVSQYKALGTKLGGYKSTLSKIQSKEYGKKHADWKAQEEISLYNEIGGTVANIIGIAKEAKELKKLQPLERPDRPTVGPSQMQPDEISSEDFGFLDANERQDLGIESDVTGTILDNASSFGKGMLMGGPSGDVLGKLGTPRSEQIAFKSGLQIQEQEYLKKVGKPKSDVTMDYERAQDLSGLEEKKRMDFSTEESLVKGWKEEDLANPLFNQKQKVAPSQNVLDETNALYEQTLKENDNIAFDAVKGGNEKPIMGYDKNEVIDIASQSVPRGRESEIQMVYGMESSYGQDPGAQGNILQIKNKGLLKEAGNIDLSDPQSVSKFYIKKTDEFTKDFSKYKVQTGSMSGETFDIFGALETQGIDKAGTRYLTWQQGRKGVADMTTALETGKIGEKTVENMLNNLSEDQKKSIIAAHGKPPYDDTKLLGFSKKSGTKNFIQAWLKIQNEKMGKY